jgi:hypothetical protein
MLVRVRKFAADWDNERCGSFICIAIAPNAESSSGHTYRVLELEVRHQIGFTYCDHGF